MQSVAELIEEARQGQHIMMDEEYKDRGYNRDRYSRGSRMHRNAVTALQVRGFDDHGQRTKETMFDMGMGLITTFCRVNEIPMPDVNMFDPKDWRVKACAYYRPHFRLEKIETPHINICLPKCAAVGTAGMAWSCPGYIVDRTPCGVLAHELGHHVDWHAGKEKHTYSSDFGAAIRKASGEPKLTNYCPNDAEWFAEMSRLFVTNSDLLRLYRPKTYNLLIGLGWKPVIIEPWFERLIDAPERTVVACARKLLKNG